MYILQICYVFYVEVKINIYPVLNDMVEQLIHVSKVRTTGPISVIKTGNRCFYMIAKPYCLHPICKCVCSTGNIKVSFSTLCKGYETYQC